MSERYKVVEGSESAHCCFEASILDMTKPVLIGGEHYRNKYEQICECFSMDEAKQIASALNQRAELLDALKDMVGCMEQENPLSYAENIRNAKEAINRAEE